MGNIFLENVIFSTDEMSKTIMRTSAVLQKENLDTISKAVEAFLPFCREDETQRKWTAYVMNDMD